MDFSIDQLITIMFENRTTRANMVQINSSWKRILTNHTNLPREANNVLGQLTVASILLSSTIKHKGSVALQVYGEGALKLAYAECSSDLKFKSTIKFKKNKKLGNLSFKEMVNGGKKGVFSVILDQKIRNIKPYQGIIPVEGNNVSEMIKNYLKNSEQIDSDLLLHADSEAATGILIQKMPDKKNELETEWYKLKKIISTIELIKMKGIDTTSAAKYYFGSLNYSIIKNKMPVFSCHCSIIRVVQMLKSLGKENMKELISSKGRIEVSCDFCNNLFSFDKTQCKKLFDFNT